MNSPTTDDAMFLLDDRKQIDAICDRFEADWRSGERPDLSSFLASSPESARARLFRELLALDLDFRRAAGEPVDVRFYGERFPEYRHLIDTAFARASSEPEGTATQLRDPETTQEGSEPSRGTYQDRVGEALRDAGYEIERELGRGGMGVVYQAKQVALNRIVALKVIKTGGFATDNERLRFRNEAEAVAQLDHPQIVPVYEVGESCGLLFFSMKLIAGSCLDDRLGTYRADPRASARVVALVAEAVHHAHQRGILHRDLKPANILIDERGEPHVTDFGLARRIEGDVDLTRSGLILGTPAYMSPEQAKGIKGTLTTATDVYGLGSILYALLTGRAPHSGSTFVETLDLVREVSPEPPSRQNPNVPRDLEIICLKCLEKDPKRRYPDAQALADDLRRWLSGEPIMARPVGRFTRLGMWYRRHPLPAALAGLLILSIVGGFAGVTWKWREAERARLKADRLVKYLTNDVLSEASTEVNPRSARFTVLQMLDRSSARIGGDFQGQPEIEAAIRETVGGAYLSLGQHAQAEAQLRAALKLDTELYGPEHATTLHVANLLADLLDQAGRYEEAEPLIRRNLAVCRRVLGPEDPTTLAAANHLGTLLRKQKRLDEAEPLLRGTLATRRKALPVDHPETLQSVRNLSLLLVDRARFNEAEALAQEYEHGIRCARGPKHPDNVEALANRGLIRRLQGKLDQAEPYYRQARDEARRILGDDHPLTLAATADHANILQALGKPAEPTKHE
jgi:tetratricopeptide (TPR) repeat protein/predicted Ser/Thr protein kinase